MADRSTLRFDFAPLQSGVSVAWNTLASLTTPRFQVKASGFGPTIETFETGDQTEAFAMYAGNFSFGGECHHCRPAEVFETTDVSTTWQNQLHNLHWLQHFSASKSNLHAHFALRLIGRWARSKKLPSDVESLSAIIIALATHGHSLVQKCNLEIQAEFLFIFTQQFKKLHRKSTHHPTASAMKAIAELYAVAAFNGFEQALPAAATSLHINLEKIILPDGGHMDRDSLKQVQLLSLLLPLQKALKTKGHHVPLNVIDRMLPMLRLTSHADGSLAFTQNHPALSDLVHKILDADVDKAKSYPLAHQTGIAKLESKKSCLIANTKDNFAIEFSEDKLFLFNNTVRITQMGETAEFKQSPQGNLLYMANSEGFERSCFMSADGSDLRVEDVHPGTFEMHFEIHPSIKISSLREGRGFMLVSPDRSAWNLTFRGAEIHTEQNGYVIKAINQDHRCINWALKKQSKSAKSPRSKTTAMDLLDL